MNTKTGLRGLGIVDFTRTPLTIDGYHEAFDLVRSAYSIGNTNSSFDATPEGAIGVSRSVLFSRDYNHFGGRIHEAWDISISLVNDIIAYLKRK